LETNVCRFQNGRFVIDGKGKGKGIFLGRVLAFLGPEESDLASGVAQAFEDAVEPLPAGPGEPAPLHAQVMRFIPGPQDVVLERAADGGATTLVRCTADCTVFVTNRLAPETDMLRRLVCAAGGQVYCFDGDVVYASEKYVAIHAAKDGIKRISVPCKARLADAFTGETLPGNETFADVSMKTGETLLLEIQRYE